MADDNTANYPSVKLSDYAQSLSPEARQIYVNMPSMYLTDAANVAIFPVEDGSFSSLDLRDHDHYEVHGEAGQTQEMGPAPAHAPAAGSSRQFAFRSGPPVTANMSVLTRSVSTPRSFHRAIHVSDVVEGKLLSRRVVMVRFTEAEATVSIIIHKLKVAMADDEDYTLTDTAGNEIVESEGTTGSMYWKQSARKIFDIKTSTFQQWRRRHSSHRNEDVQRLQDQVEELLEASQGLGEVTRNIDTLVTLSRNLSPVWLEFKQAFICLVCRATMTRPMFTSCCRSLVGCVDCVREWERNSNQCLKCREDLPTYTEVAGLSAALDCLRSTQ
ncbi:uncharacterized protein LOC127537677 [Acanthochromis polyacanthus]|uniref:uncharacterized protein LOC127530563 n=1 Tax=Acanthochromis polyacanthus TaxID=80966 RepID=UPI0022345553|nr:uncharacterized protein LOC127530563 [Acanthochromis polyacanthus]XP_051797515.1 uncharacterized protein LOC110953533 [Acanthochromis polyacanthus]XP_051816584.1 uncharacterized protein LOC127537677 [Acanthochromis polyacanthus]